MNVLQACCLNRENMGQGKNRDKQGKSADETGRVPVTSFQALHVDACLYSGAQISYPVTGIWYPVTALFTLAVHAIITLSNYHFITLTIVTFVALQKLHAP